MPVPAGPILKRYAYNARTALAFVGAAIALQLLVFRFTGTPASALSALSLVDLGFGLCLIFGGTWAGVYIVCFILRLFARKHFPATVAKCSRQAAKWAVNVALLYDAGILSAWVVAGAGSFSHDHTVMTSLIILAWILVTAYHLAQYHRNRLLAQLMIIFKLTANEEARVNRYQLYTAVSCGNCIFVSRDVLMRRWINYGNLRTVASGSPFNLAKWMAEQVKVSKSRRTS